MSDQVSTQEAQAENYKSHEWWFRMERTSQPVKYEFGMAITKDEAARRIAKLHKLRELPSSATVARGELQRLDPLPAQEKSAKPKPD